MKNDLKEWDFMYPPEDDPKPIKYTAIARVIDNELVTVYTEMGVVKIEKIEDVFVK
jgi:hypothetical protein